MNFLCFSVVFLSIASTTYGTLLPGQSYLFAWSSSAKKSNVQSQAVDIPWVLSEVEAQKRDSDILLIWKWRYADVALLQLYRNFFDSASSRTSYENAVIRLSSRDSSLKESELPITSQILKRDAWKSAKHLSSLSDVSQELKKDLLAAKPRSAKSPVYVVEADARGLKEGQNLVAEIQQTIAALTQQTDRVLVFFYMEPEESVPPSTLTHLPAGQYSRLLASSSSSSATSTPTSISTSIPSDAAVSSPSPSGAAAFNASSLNNYSPEGCEYSMYYGGKYLYITPDIFTGIMTGLFFVFVFFIGLGQLSAIQ
eukprot:gene27928-36792_t